VSFFRQERITINTDQNDTEYTRKETSPTSVDDFPIDKSSDDLGAAADTTQGAYDVPIAERLKLRRKKSSAAKKDNTPTDGEVNTPKLNISLRKRKSLVLPGSEFNSSRKKRVPSGGIAKKKDAARVSNDISMSKSSRSLRKRKSSVLDGDKDSNTYTTSSALKAGGSTEESCAEEEEEEARHLELKPELAADLVVLPSHLRKKKASGHPLCKIKGCDKQGRSEKDEMCKAHYNTFKMAGRNTKDSGEEVESQLKSDCTGTVTERRSNRKKIAPELFVARPSTLGVGEDDEEEALYPDVAELKILPIQDRIRKESGHPLCKVEGCTKQGQGSTTDDMCKGHFTLFKKAGMSTKESDEEEEEEALYPDVAELKILPIQDRIRKESGHPLCKVEGCTKQGQGSTTDDMCKGHFTLFKKAGRSTKETGEEAGVFESDNKDSSMYLGGKVAAAEEEEDEALYSDVAELKIVPKEDRLNNANGIPFCKVEGCPKQGRNESDQMCRSHFNMFQKAGRSTKETGEKIVVEELPPVKRGRGRPRKIFEIDTYTKQEKLLVVNEPSLVKRGRGRPRKNPIVDRPPFEKRGRGRPRKSSTSQHATEVGDRPDSSTMLTSLFSFTRKSSETSDAQLVEEDIRGQPIQARGKPVTGLPEKSNVERTMTLRTNRVKSSKLRANEDAVVDRPPFEKRGRPRSRQLSREASKLQNVEKKTMTLRKHRVKSSKLRTDETDTEELVATKRDKETDVGVREMQSGNWEVWVSYQRKRCVMGTFHTLDEAVLANRIARSMLITERGVYLSGEETDINIQSAKEAITAAGITASNQSGQQSSKDIDYSSVGVYQTVSGSWVSVHTLLCKDFFFVCMFLTPVSNLFTPQLQTVILNYQGKQRGMGTYRMKAEAVLANKVARNMLATTKNSVLSTEESMQNVKLAKETASKAVSEMHSSGGSIDNELNVEPGTLAPGRWQSNKVRRDSFVSPFAFNLVFYPHTCTNW